MYCNGYLSWYESKNGTCYEEAAGFYNLTTEFEDWIGSFNQTLGDAFVDPIRGKGSFDLMKSSNLYMYSEDSIIRYILKVQTDVHYVLHFQRGLEFDNSEPCLWDYSFTHA